MLLTYLKASSKEENLEYVSSFGRAESGNDPIIWSSSASIVNFEKDSSEIFGEERIEKERQKERDRFWIKINYCKMFFSSFYRHFSETLTSFQWALVKWHFFASSASSDILQSTVMTVSSIEVRNWKDRWILVKLLCKGKYHCTADPLFHWFEFDRRSKPVVNLNLSR